MILAVPRQEIIASVVVISTDKRSCGSSLIYVHNGILYYITAAHVLKSMPHGIPGDLYVSKNRSWTHVKVIPYFVSGRPYHEGDIDLAVIKTEIEAPNSVEINLSSAGVIMGQDVYFLGFPYFGNSIDHRPEAINNGFPLPFVKKATFSAMQDPLMYLDGHNNPGFSGGPVVFWDYQENKYKILGIVSGYLSHIGKIKIIETSAEKFYEENSGIGVAYNIRYINELLKLIG